MITEFGYKQFIKSTGRNVRLEDRNGNFVVENADIPDLIAALQEHMIRNPR